MKRKYRVCLTADERDQVEAIIRTGHVAARVQTHARSLLKTDQGQRGPAWADETIAEACEVSSQTVHRVRRAFAAEGLDAALYRKKSGVVRRKLDGRQEAQLVSLACSSPPDGHERWTLRLLAERLVELNVVDTIARDTVRLTLKKMN